MHRRLAQGSAVLAWVMLLVHPVMVEGGGGLCVLVVSDPELRAAKPDSIWHQGGNGMAFCRIKGRPNDWMVDYVWGQVSSHPGVLFNFTQLDSLAARGEITGSTTVEVATYRTRVEAKDPDEARSLAERLRPRDPPQDVRAAVAGARGGLQSILGGSADSTSSTAADSAKNR